MFKEIKRIESILIKMERDRDSDPQEKMKLYEKRLSLIDLYKNLKN